VRLRYGYFVTCTGVDKDAQGAVTALRCTYDPATKGGNAPDGRKVKGTIHWVSARTRSTPRCGSTSTCSRDPDPASADGGDFLEAAESRTARRSCAASSSRAWRRPRAASASSSSASATFCTDPDSRPGQLVFNRTATLRDTWAKVAKQSGPGGD
jgi:glutaminyl-tRNA synthetase